jgi:hypothetical protein
VEAATLLPSADGKETETLDVADSVVQSVGQKTSADCLLMGCLEVQETGLALQTRLFDTAAGKPLPQLAAHRPFGKPADLFFAVHQVANALHVGLTGHSLSRLPTIFDDGQRAQGAGLLAAGALPTPATSDFRVSLEIDRPGGVYRVNETVLCTVESGIDCYVAIYNLGADAQPHWLIPHPEYLADGFQRQGNGYVSTVRIQAGRKYRVPADFLGEGTLRVLPDKPTGYEALVVVASTAPVLLPVADSGGGTVSRLTLGAASPAELAAKEVGISLETRRAGAKVAVAEVKFSTAR